MYKVAFIGGGINSAIGRTHKISSQMDGKFELVAGAFSRNVDINQATSEEFGIEKNRLYANYRELLSQEKGNLDAVIVLTPTNTHSEIVIDCINTGLPVICEKSLATNLQTGVAIRNAVQEQKGFLCVTYNYTGYPQIRVLREKVQKGELGKITKVVVEMPQEGYIRYTSDGKVPCPQEWRLRDYDIPTISLDLGTHLHNMISFLTGERPKTVIGQENTYGFFSQVIDDVSCIIDYTNDMTTQMWFSKAALGHRNGLRVRIYGTEASAEWYQMEPEILRMSNKKGEIILFDRSNDITIGLQDRYNRFKVGHPAGFIEAFANYYSDIAAMLDSYINKEIVESEYILELDKSLEGLALFEAVHRSSAKRTWEEIEM